MIIANGGKKQDPANPIPINVHPALIRFPMERVLSEGRTGVIGGQIDSLQTRSFGKCSTVLIMSKCHAMSDKRNKGDKNSDAPTRPPCNHLRHAIAHRFDDIFRILVSRASLEHRVSLASPTERGANGGGRIAIIP